MLQKRTRDFLLPGENSFLTQQSDPHQDQQQQIQQIQPVQYEQPTTFRPNPYIHLQRQQQSILPTQQPEAQITHREDRGSVIYEQQKQQLAHQLLINRGLIPNYNQQYQPVSFPQQQLVHVQHLQPVPQNIVPIQQITTAQPNTVHQQIPIQTQQHIVQQPISTVRQTNGHQQHPVYQQFGQQRADQFNPNFYQHQYNEQQAYNQLLNQQRLYEEQQFRQSLSRNYNRFDLTPNNPTIHLFG